MKDDLALCNAGLEFSRPDWVFAWQVMCNGENAANSQIRKVMAAVSDESTMTVCNGARAAKLYEDEVGTLAQVVSKYLPTENSSQCFLSIQVPYSEDADSSTSSVSPSTDTATSATARSQRPEFLPPIPVEASLEPVEMITCLSKNPDNLQSILPLSVSSAMRDSWLNCSNSSSSSSSVVRNSWTVSPAAQPHESWSNLCELPAAWQYYTDPGLVANEMEHELVDVKRELAMRCEGAVAAWPEEQSFQDEGCDACFFSDDWRWIPAAAHTDSCSVSSASDATSDVEYLCIPGHPVYSAAAADGAEHHQLMGYDILGMC
jgi:hypothetical protein